MPNHIHKPDIPPRPIEKFAAPAPELSRLIGTCTHIGIRISIRQQAPPLLPGSHVANTPPPLGPNGKRLLSPCPERHFLYHRRRHDLLRFEAAPRDGVHAVGLLARVEIARRVNGVEGYVTCGGEAVEAGFEVRVEGGGGDEEFDEGFLEDEAARGTPAVGCVRGGKAVHGGLGGDCPVGFLGCEAFERGFYELCFGR